VVTIIITTLINAPIERVFDLCRSIDAHQHSTATTSEVAVGGRTSGLIEIGEEVQWEAYHFGIKQRLSSKISSMSRPNYFQREFGIRECEKLSIFLYLKAKAKFCEECSSAT
jgi:hypothetical protein